MDTSLQSPAQAQGRGRISTSTQEEELQLLTTTGRPLNAYVTLITQEEEEIQLITTPGQPLNAYVTLITTQEEEELQIIATEEEIQILTTPGRPLNANKVDFSKYVEQHTYVFNDVFDADANNEEVYKRTAIPLVTHGGKATCFASGRTGSSKAFMLDQRHGLYIYAGQEIFTLLQDRRFNQLASYIGFYEAYQGQLFDIMNQRKKIFPQDDGSDVIFAELREFKIDNSLLECVCATCLAQHPLDLCKLHVIQICALGDLEFNFEF
ncbi:hypothetical protein RhiirA5_500046 [Rhizophagus irregularis]|uniref:Kinesin motor domain-containing protein n=2 Tax=Rhizophagus irregularis TaxID=588596 RepID=U9T4I7_RHIID|nr:hypothetical protein GLOIN_2v1691970 [Rhizophagus irregularis DAOM 181602=DAOM 197198]PKC08338.1 hypothetical protein RhiirA5_500046 [Rhizophagus irregularis]PKC63520.1 hypothetical protein RhiirA1_537700 [Rhizophagus irregularis]PKK73595.1 hypothetical protein RhiirC2_740518 [Rhizophagus irregularis]PKY28690.1 hypothetical protein RhiirB3_530024 [Rhizophagus irregularis]POG62812.1 hypothetical protein GLOIN_2v1691970 [Rhizophagus irregularis DAOM 181602=DAOM 197198]|eukprot:XP_025169678.1 hypothetical protein GLOIN_2v1691970 [Rhizophagus irregularis DAOM 181602=DAOM 197198]